MPGKNEKIRFELTAEDRASRVLRRLDQQFDRLGGNSTRQFDRLQRSARGVEQSLNRLGRVVVGGLGLAAMARATRGAINEAARFETGLVAVAKTTNATEAELKDLTAGVERLERIIPRSATALLGMASAAGQLGVKGTQNILKFTETMARLEAATDIQGEQGARDLARLLNVTGESVSDIDRLGSAIAALGNDYAGTENEIVQMATYVGQSIGQFDASAREVVGLSAAMKELGLRAELSGSSVGRAFRAIQTITQSTGKQTELLATLMGRSAEEIAEAFRTDAVGTFLDFLEALSQTGDRTTAVLTGLKLAGDENLKVFPTLARNVDAVRARLEQSETAWRENRALIEESTRAAQTYASQLQLFQNRWAQLNRNVGRAILPSLNDALLQGNETFDLFFANVEGGWKALGLGALAAMENLWREILQSGITLWNSLQAAAAGSFAVIANTLERLLKRAFNNVLAAAQDAINRLLSQIELINRVLPGALNFALPKADFGGLDVPAAVQFGDVWSDTFEALDAESSRWLDGLLGETGVAQEKLEQLTADNIRRRQQLAAAALGGGGEQSAKELATDTQEAVKAAEDLAGALASVGTTGAQGVSAATRELQKLENAADGIRSRFATPAEELARTLERINAATGPGGLSAFENQEFSRRAQEEFDQATESLGRFEGAFARSMQTIRGAFGEMLRGGIDDWKGFLLALGAELAAIQADEAFFGQDGLLSGLFSNLGSVDAVRELTGAGALTETATDNVSAANAGGGAVSRIVEKISSSVARDFLAASSPQLYPEPPRGNTLALPVNPGIEPGALDLFGIETEAAAAGGRASEAFAQAFVLPAANVEGFTQGFDVIETAAGRAAAGVAGKFEQSNSTILDSIFKMVDSAAKALGGLAKNLFNLVGSSLGSIDLSSIFSFLPSFDGGGFTGTGSRVGGIDGKGGFLGVLHPREKVIDYTRAGGGGGAGVMVNQTLNIQPGVSQEMIPQILRAAQEGTLAAIRDQGRRGGQRARALGFA